MPFITNNEVIISLKCSGSEDEKIFKKKYRQIINFLSKDPNIYKFESKFDHYQDELFAGDLYIIKVTSSWAYNMKVLFKFIEKLEDN